MYRFLFTADILSYIFGVGFCSQRKNGYYKKRVCHLDLCLFGVFLYDRNKI